MGEGTSTGSYQNLETYRETPYRFINFAIYVLAALVNSLPAQTFSSINTLVETAYGYDPVVITLFTLFFPIFHPICAFPANWVLDKFGMKIGCCIGGVLLIIGVWMRTLLEYGEPAWCLIGSLLAAVGNVFVLNSPSILANNWFKPASIPGVISFAVLANLVSVTLGNAIPGLVLAGDIQKEHPDEHEIKKMQEDIQQFLRIEAIIISAVFVLVFIGLRTRPEVPPSKSAENQEKNKENYVETLKKLFKNKEYLKIMFIMTFNYGVIMSYLPNLDQTLKDVGFTKPGVATSYIVISAMFSGIIGSFFFVQKIKQTLQYKAIIVINLFLCFFMFVLTQIVLLENPADTWVLLIMGACIGFFAIPITSLLMAYSSEVVFPLGEGSATGYLFAASQTFGSILGLSSASLINAKDEASDSLWTVYTFMGLHAGFLLVSCVFSLYTKNTLNRTEFLERKSKNIYENESADLVYSGAEVKT